MDLLSHILGQDWGATVLLGMTAHTWVTALVITLIVGGLISGRFGADLILLGGLAALLFFGILTPQEALHGFANPAVGSVAVLYIVAAGLRETGAMTAITSVLLGRPKTLLGAQIRLTLPVAGASALVNNTPIVAMFLPVLSGWARKNNISTSRLFMPLSFAAMLGGMCTLIGTSTNLVVAGLVQDHLNAGDNATTIQPIGMFTLTKVGLPVAAAGIVYMLLFGRRLLRDRDRRAPLNQDPRQYMTAMRVESHSSIVGKTIENAGLRQLPGLFLARIERGSDTLFAPSPEQKLASEDVLVFVGVIDSVVDLQRLRGLTPVAADVPEGQDESAASPTTSRRIPRRYANKLIEAVVSGASPLLGQTIRDAGFRSRYGAVVIGAHRNGQRISGKLGDIRLRQGDTLLLEAPRDFAEAHKNSKDFHLVSELPGAAAPRHHLAPVAIAILIGMVVLITIAPAQVMTFTLIAALLMILTRCCTGPQARASVDWQVLLVIGASFGLARAMESTGLSTVIAREFVSWAAPMGLTGLLAAIFVITALFTSVISNNAAAVLMFPIALETARSNHLPFTPFVVCLAIAASSGFSTPLGYQTNLMILGPGGYKPHDFLRYGGPLTVLIGIITVVLAPLMY